MAMQQCPNCRGFKSYRWFSKWLSRVAGVALFSVVPAAFFTAKGAPEMGAILLLIGAWYGLMLLWDLLRRPRKAYVCEICEFNWNLGELAPAGSSQVDLLAMGTALLERQAAAARAAEEEEEREREEKRQREEHRRIYGV